MIVPPCAPDTCNPIVAVILGAFLALSVFVGCIAAGALVDRIREFRERRLKSLHQPSKGDNVKKLIAAMFVALAVRAQAAPYFRVVDPSHPQPVVGALVDPIHPGESSAASLLPIFTHSPEDGCLLPSIVCEDWTPFAVGAAMNAGKITLDFAPLANILPWMQSAGQAVIPRGWTVMRSLVDYQGDKTDPITFSAGPVWEYSQIRNKGSFKLFTGLALHF